jgi:hypothetical protein
MVRYAAGRELLKQLAAGKCAKAWFIGYSPLFSLSNAALEASTIRRMLTKKLTGKTHEDEPQR